MTRIALFDTTELTDSSTRAKELLDATKRQLGRIPNLYSSMAQSPTALEAYLSFRAVLIKGVLSTQMMERIALLTAAVNDCAYCVSAHSFRGAKIGMSESDLAATQKAQSDNAKDQTALQFVVTLIEQRGQIPDNDYAVLKASGWSDEEIGEIVAHVALNVFSNYFNHVAQPELDFPLVAVAR